jgi:hypothetical protein
VRPAIAFVIFASGLKYVGVPTQALGWILCATLLAGAVTWLWTKRPWENQLTAPRPAPLPVLEDPGDEELAVNRPGTR